MDKQKESTDSSSNRTLVTRHNDSSTSLNVLNLLDNQQLAAAELLITKLMKSSKSGITSVADGLAVLSRAQDLQLPFSTCIEHIHIINGKTGVDIHIIKSLLSRAGVVWECTKDYAPQYQYTDGNTIYIETQLPQYCVKCRTAKEAIEATNGDTIGVYPVQWFQDLKGNVYNESQVSDKCVKAINKVQALKIANEGKFPIIRIPAQPVDFVTEYKFTRWIKVYDKVVEKTTISHFSYSEAQLAGLLDKDTYKKYTRVLVSHRAFTLGARDIASDLIMGCRETTELKTINDMDIVDSDIIEEVSYEDASES